MPYIPPRRRRKQSGNNAKLKQALIDLVIKLVGETVKAKMARAVAIGAVGGISQYAIIPEDPTKPPDIPVVNAAPIPTRPEPTLVDLKVSEQ